jgi:hypothetical protein
MHGWRLRAFKLAFKRKIWGGEQVLGRYVRVGHCANQRKVLNLKRHLPSLKIIGFTRFNGQILEKHRSQYYLKLFSQPPGRYRHFYA